MAITRRQFIKGSGLAAAGSFLGPGLFNNPFIQKALADTIGDRYFVVLFLNGGNDGLNTVTPATNGGGSLRTAYDAARLTGVGGINLSPGDLAGTLIGTDPNTGAQLALHPGLGGLKSLYDLGKVAVIQGCGYPDYNLSHEQSRRVWQTGNPGLAYSSGWMGRYLAANYVGSDIPGVNVGFEVSGEFIQAATTVLALQSVQQFAFPYDRAFEVVSSGDNVLKRDVYLSLYGDASVVAQPTIQYVGATGTATLLTSENYPALHDVYVADRPTFNQAYDAVNRDLARDLREVAKVIYGVKRGVPSITARFFQVSNGGYDTHSDQGGADANGQHFTLHAEVADSLEVFYQDCADMGVADKLCILVWSEFSRRIMQNDNGTDHGSQGPMFVIGGGVNGGVYGNHPNVDALALDSGGNTVYSQDDANPFRSTDLRDVYGTVLKHWLNMDPGTILASILPPDGGDPASYWTAPNFDVGFLP